MPAKPAFKTCFVIGPIGAASSPARTHADWLLEGIIQPVFDGHYKDFIVQRSDKISEPGMIDSQIINLLLDCEMVIADMSLLNVNAFYEMGIRHMAQRPIIHMFIEGSEIPFDVKPYRAIPFSIAHPKNLVAAQALLLEALREALNTDHVIDNPVTRARGSAQFTATATEPEKLLAEELRALKDRVAEIENARPRSLSGKLIGSQFGQIIDKPNLAIKVILDSTVSAKEKSKLIQNLKFILDMAGIIEIKTYHTIDGFALQFFGALSTDVQNAVASVVEANNAAYEISSY